MKPLFLPCTACSQEESSSPALMSSVMHDRQVASKASNRELNDAPYACEDDPLSISRSMNLVPQDIPRKKIHPVDDPSHISSY